jgi:hypothetical protein
MSANPGETGKADPNRTCGRVGAGHDRPGRGSTAAAETPETSIKQGVARKPVFGATPRLPATPDGLRFMSPEISPFRAINGRTHDDSNGIIRTTRLGWLAGRLDQPPRPGP